MEQLLEKSVYAGKSRIIDLSGFLSSQIYVWRREIKERKKREPALYTEEAAAALENILDYPHMGGKKGTAMMAYRQREYIGQRCYDGLKSRYRQLLFIEMKRRNLLPQKTKWVKDMADHYGEIWCADFTHVVVRDYIVYIAVVLDDYSHYYLGCHVSLWEDVELTEGAFQMAIETCKGVLPERYMINDRGSQYKAELYRQQVNKFGIQQLFVPRRSPWYNGEAEAGMRDIQARFYYRLAQTIIHSDSDILVRTKEIADVIFKELNEQIPRLKLNGVTPKDVVTKKAEQEQERIKAFINKRKYERKNKTTIQNVDQFIKNKLNLEQMDKTALKNRYYLINCQYHKIKPKKMQGNFM